MRISLMPSAVQLHSSSTTTTTTTRRNNNATFGILFSALLLLSALSPSHAFSLFGRRARSAILSSLSEAEESTTSSPVAEIAEAVNGGTYLELLDTDEVGDDSELLNKRVPVAIRYSAESGLKPYYLTIAKKIKDSHPDVIIDKVILPFETTEGENGETPTFEVVVDGKVVVRGPGRAGRKNASNSMSIFVSSEELDLAIARARRRRRPATVYGEDGNVRMEILRTKPPTTVASTSTSQD